MKHRSIFFFNDTATTEIYTLSLHDALPISLNDAGVEHIIIGGFAVNAHGVIRPSKDLDIVPDPDPENLRSEEHTSELQSRQYLVCRLLLEKKNLYILHSIALTSDPNSITRT